MATYNTIVTVVDATSHVAVSNALIFINGVRRASTDSSGQASVILVIGVAYTLSITADTYDAFSSPIVAGQPTTANLQPQAILTVTKSSFHLNIHPDGPSDGAKISFDNAGFPKQVAYTSNTDGITIDDLTVGPQIVTGSIPGFNSFTNTFFVTDLYTIGNIQLTASDTGTTSKQETAVAQIDPNASLPPAITPEQLPEFLPPNTNQGTYFTMTQARMYIGTLFIDELNGLQFALQDNKIPIYGYASRYYDAIAQGKSLVQGQFTINFVSEGYLYVTLQEYQRMITSGKDATNVVADEQQAKLTKLTNSILNPDVAWTSNQLSTAKDAVRTMVASMGSSGPAALDAAKASMAVTRKQQLSNTLGLSGPDYSNAVYSDISFDLVVQYSGAGRTVVRMLEDCHLISNESIMDHSGTPILDSYGFVARRLR